MEVQIEDQIQVPVFYERFIETMSTKIKLFRSSPWFYRERVCHSTKKGNFKKNSPVIWTKKWKCLSFSLDGENGLALFKVSNNSTTDEDMIISETAKIIRKSMFKNVEILDGNFSFQKQKGLVSKQLVQLIPLILEDNTWLSEAGKCTQTEAIKVNSSQKILSHLARFCHKKASIIR